MHILVLPSYYPDNDNDNLGLFFKEQVHALSENNNKVGVVYVEMKSLRKFSLKQIFNYFFQFEISTANQWTEYRVKGWKIPSFIGDQIWLYLTRKLINKYIKLNGKPDVIHAHNTFLAGIAAHDLFMKIKINYLITEHDSDFLDDSFTQKQKLKISKVYSKSMQVISVSKALKKAMSSIAPTIDIKVIPNIVNTDYFKPKRENLKSTVLTFLAIGNLTENKNHKLIINAFYEISKSNDNIKLVICGDGPEKLNLIKLVKKYSLEEKVDIKGFLNRGKILKELQNATCLVHTSNFETFGVVLIEALSCGLPFISTKSGGPNDIFEKGMGYLINKNNLKELINTLLHFIDNKSSFNNSVLREIAINSYSRDKVYKRLHICFHKLKQFN